MTPKRILTERMPRDGHGSAQVGGGERSGVSRDTTFQTVTKQVYKTCEYVNQPTERCGTRTDDPRTRRTSGHDLNNQACQKYIDANCAQNIR